MADKNQRPVIIVKKKKKGGHGHHGGAWKVAYADFVTAMMAFFLVMWLVTAVSKEQRAAIFDYFKNPSMEPGKSTKPAPGMMGPGGASTSPIDLHGGLNAISPPVRRPKDIASTKSPVLSLAAEKDAADPNPLLHQSIGGGGPTHTQTAKATAEELAAAQKEADHKNLESLMAELKAAVDKSQALEPFKDQLLLDITPEGVRIQIVDAQNRPMFDVGSSRMRDYTVSILRELAPYLDSVPNRVSLTGHTDIRPYPSTNGYTNWELSADRANAARRALVAGGLPDEKISRVVGLSSSVLFDKKDPQNPINRRISIVVMTRQAEEDALKTDEAPPSEAAPEATPGQPSTPAPVAATGPATATGQATAAGQAAAAPTASATPSVAAAAAPQTAEAHR